jgi:predicted MFS family arabinose efflux permease
VSKPERALRRLVAVVCLVQVADLAVVQVLAPLLPFYADRLGFGPAESGRIVAAFAAGALVSAIPAGMLCSRIGVKPTVIAGLLVMAGTTLAFGFAGSTLALQGARFGQGIASSLAWTGAIAWIAGAAPAGRRGSLLGIVFGVGVAGTFAGPGVGVLAAHHGTEETFAGIAAALVALAVAASLLPGVPAARQPARAILGALRHRGLAFGVWLYLLPAFLLSAQNAVAPLRLDELGWSVAGIGAIYVSTAGVQAVWSPLLGRWLDRAAHTTPVVASLLAAACLTSVLALPWTRERWLFAVLVAAANVSFVTFYLPGAAIVADGAEAAGLDHAFGFSLANLAWAPGTVLGSILGGELAEGIGDSATYVMLAAFCAATLLVLRRVAPRPAAEQAPA